MGRRGPGMALCLWYPALRDRPALVSRCPRNDEAFDQFDGVVKHDAHDRKQQQGTEGKRRARLRCRNQDQIAEPLIRSYEFTDDSSDDGESDRDLEPDENMRDGG